MRTKLAYALTLLVVAATIGGAPGAARADDYLLEEGFRRDGLMFGIALGGGGFLSTSCCDIGGRRGAGAGSVRIGTAMSPHRLWVLQVDAGDVFVKDRDGSTKHNRHSALTLGLQHYLFDTFWLKTGVGFATYKIAENDDNTAAINLERNGFSASGSIGYDFFQWPDAFFKWRQDLAVSLEFGMVAAVYPGGTPITGDVEQETGLIIQLHSMVGFVWY